MQVDHHFVYRDVAGLHLMPALIYILSIGTSTRADLGRDCVTYNMGDAEHCKMPLVLSTACGSTALFTSQIRHACC